MMKVIETAPEMSLSPNDIEGLLGKLREYHGIYSPLFSRREQREHAGRYMEGLVSDIDNKAIEPMVLDLCGADQNVIRAMQHFIGEGTWKDDPILRQHLKEVDKDLGDEAGVFLGYASEQGYTLLERRLYLPEEWVKEEAYAERRNKCAIPKDIVFKTKPQLSLEMLRTVVGEGTLRARWVAADEAFGGSQDFLDGVAELGLWYFAEVPLSTMAWQQRPGLYVPDWSGYGRKPMVARLMPGEPQAQSALEIAQSLPARNWSRHTIKEGTKGPIEADFAILRVIASRDGLPGPEVFLILRRHPQTDELKFYLSNAPAEITHEKLILMSGMRWPIETCFEDGKQLLGMGEYQVRSWSGWHHHMTLCILSHFFLVRLRLQFKDKAPALTLPQVYVLLKGTLPRSEFDELWALDVLRYRQRRNHAAYLSHRKRRTGKSGP